MIMMAIDLGLSRTGLAICDKQELISYPLETIKEKDFNKLCLKIIEKVQKTKTQLIIIGLPRNMDGSEGESAKRSIKLQSVLKERLNTDIILWDERKTTAIATTYLNITNTKGQKRKNIIDAVSATIILGDYIRFKKTLN
ncbi:MAG: Holliday junction resolvase RuvX [Oscillospiraceae bacterium]|jgi:putative Holliday junction resolvase|nr:Holliday junction resolvase RuvX [Oscillospiraceae bacterium]